MSGLSAAASVASTPLKLTFRAVISRYPESRYSLRVLDISGRASDEHVRPLYESLFSDLEQLQTSDLWGDRFVLDLTDLAPQTDVKRSCSTAAQTFFVGVRETNGEGGGALVECAIYDRKDLDDKFLLSVFGGLITVGKAGLETVDLSNLSEKS